MRRSTTTFALVAALALAGCGGDDDDDAETPPASGDVAAFRAELKPICLKAAERSGRALGARDIADFERYGREAGVAVKAFREELKLIEPPPELADKWRLWLTAIDDDIATYNLAMLAGSVRNREAVHEQTSKLSAARPGKAARALGIPECAEPTDRAAHVFSAGPGS